MDTINLESALTLINDSIKYAKHLDKLISVCFVDAAGIEIAGVKMDDASWFTLGVARDKAKTAAIFKKPIHTIQPMWDQYPNLVRSIEKQLSFQPSILKGGLPIINSERSTIGAVGVAGAQPDLDLEICEYIVNLFMNTGRDSGHTFGLG